MHSKQQETRDRIIHKYFQNNFCAYSIIAKYLNMPFTTEKTVIQRNLINENTNRKPGSGFTRKTFEQRLGW